MPFTAIRIPIGRADDDAAVAGADRTVDQLAHTDIETQKATIDVNIAVVGAFESEEQALAVAQRAIALLGFPVYLVDPDSGEEKSAPAPENPDVPTSETFDPSSTEPQA